MATKAEGCSCYEKAAPDEPIFVLRAKDVLAPATVKAWAQDAYKMGVPEKKINEALRCASMMEQWQDEHGSKIPD